MGEIPSYLSPEDAEKYAGLPIGVDRLLTIFEEADILATGRTREELAGLTPEELGSLAESTIDQSNVFVGS